MKKLRTGKIFYTFLFFIAISFLSYGKLILEIDRSKMYLGETMELRLIFENTDNKEAEIEGIENFDILAKGRSIETQIVNSKRRNRNIEIYRIMPKKAGYFELVARDKKGEISNTAKLEVSDQKGQSENKYFETFRDIDKRDYYFGEKIVIKEGVKSKVNLVDLSYMNSPEVKGAGLKNFNNGRVKTEISNIGGVNTLIATSFEGLVEAFEPGEIIIPKNLIRVGYETSSRGFFDNAKEEYLSLDELKLNILPLPNENKPLGFGGLVGRLVIDADVDRREVKVGEGITVTLKIKGNGNLASLNKIFPNGVEGFRIFEKENNFKEDIRSGKYYAENTYELVFIPLSKSIKELPLIKIPYFDTDKKSYAYLEFEAGKIDVLEGEAEFLPKVTGSQSVKISEIPNKKENKINKYLIFIAGLESIIIFVLIFFLLRSKICRRHKKISNKVFIRKIERSKSIDELYQVIFEYINTEYGISPQGLDFNNSQVPESISKMVLTIEEYKFQNKAVDDEIKAELINIIRRR